MAAHHDADVVLHLAAQVAVTTSVTDPRHRLRDQRARHLQRARGASAAARRRPIVLYTSTNKVYGNMEHEGVELRDGRYAYKRPGPRGEREPRRSTSTRPTAARRAPPTSTCATTRGSTGCARWSSASPASTARASSASRTRAGWPGSPSRAVLGRRITIFGDGKQVRDVLFVDDLVDCYLRAVERIDRGRGAGLQHRRRARQPALACWSCSTLLNARIGRQDHARRSPTGARATRRSSCPTSPRPSGTSAGSPRSRPPPASTAWRTGCSRRRRSWPRSWGDDHAQGRGHRRRRRGRQPGPAVGRGGAPPDLREPPRVGLVAPIATPVGVLEGGIWPTLLTSASGATHGMFSFQSLKPGTYDIENGMLSAPMVEVWRTPK